MVRKVLRLPLCATDDVVSRCKIAILLIGGVLSLEDDHAAIRRRIPRSHQQENFHHDIETDPHRLGVFLVRLPTLAYRQARSPCTASSASGKEPRMR